MHQLTTQCCFLPTKENHKNIKILLPARVLWDKGVQEFVEVAKTIKIKFKNVTFILAGDRDIQNPECIPLEKLNEWVNLGLIKWLGHYKKMGFEIEGIMKDSMVVDNNFIDEFSMSKLIG